MRPLLASALVLAAGVGLGGCSLVGPSREVAALNDARARWDASGPSSYTMTYRRLCFCPEEYVGPFAVRVASDRVVAVTFQGEPVPLDRALTVDDLFDRLAAAYARDAYRVDVTYDPALGFPTSVSIDYDTRIADEEASYSVTDLRPE